MTERRRQLSGEPDPKAEKAELKAAQKRIRELEMENEFLKKPRPSSRKSRDKAHCQLMLAEKENHPVETTAHVLKASRSGFYAWLGRGGQIDGWGEVGRAVKRVWEESDRRFDALAQAKMDVIEFIKAHCSRKRPHSAIDCKVPAQVMDAFFERTRPKEEGALPAA